ECARKLDARSIGHSAPSGADNVLRFTDEVFAAIDQFLRDPIPAGILVAAKIIVFRAREQAEVVAEVNLERAVNGKVIIGYVLPVAPGILRGERHAERGGLFADHHGAAVVELRTPVSVRADGDCER